MKPSSLISFVLKGRRLLAAGVVFIGGASGFVAGAAEQRCHQAGNVRVFYHVEGPHAVEAVDADGSGVPDQVEDALTQILAARLLFVDMLGFPDPFAGERFRGAKFLDVHFRSKELLKANGVAFDELQRYKRPTDPPDTASLAFNLATTVQPAKNLSPAHEYFHLIQYGVCYYKNSWYTEGTARWSEQGLGAEFVAETNSDNNAAADKSARSFWPADDRARETLFKRRYDAAETFWQPLAEEYAGAADHAVDQGGGELPAGPQLVQLQNLRYVDGTPVLRDSRFRGHKFLREVLLELSRADDETFRTQGYDRWSEANQFSPKNSPDILRAVERVVKRLKTED